MTKCDEYQQRSTLITERQKRFWSSFHLGKNLSGAYQVQQLLIIFPGGLYPCSYFHIGTKYLIWHICKMCSSYAVLYISYKIHHICLQPQVHFMWNENLNVCTCIGKWRVSLQYVNFVSLLMGIMSKRGNWELRMETRSAEEEARCGFMYSFYLFIIYCLEALKEMAEQTRETGLQAACVESAAHICWSRCCHGSTKTYNLGDQQGALRNVCSVGKQMD